MRYTQNINLPIVEDNDLYSKEINNLAFEKIDEEIQGLADIVEALDSPENSIADVKKDINDINEQLDTNMNEINKQFNTINTHSKMLDFNNVDDVGIVINNAIRSGNTNISLPSGEYQLKSEVIINNGNVVIKGNSTILHCSDSGRFLLDGSSVPAYRMNSYLSDIVLIGDLSLNYGIRLLNLAEVTLENIVIKTFDCGIISNNSLIYLANNIKIDNCNIGYYFDSDTTEDNGVKCNNLIKLDNLKIINCKNQAIKSIGDSNSIEFSNCEIEHNGVSDNTNNIVEFIGYNKIGAFQPIIFNNCWFESNVGSSDIYIEPSNKCGGISLINTTLISTNVDYNLHINNAIVVGEGVSCNASVNQSNVNFVNVTGYFKGLYRSINKSGSVNVVALDRSEFDSSISISNLGSIKLYKDLSSYMEFKKNTNGGLTIENIKDLDLSSAYVRGGSYRFIPRNVTDYPTLSPLSIFVNSSNQLCFLDQYGVTYTINVTKA